MGRSLFKKKSVVAERFIRTLTSKIYNYRTSKSKNVYIDKQFDIVNECNNTYHSSIKIKFSNVKSRNIYFNTEEKDKDLEFKVADHIRISKHRNIFAKKVTLQIELKEYLRLKKLKILLFGHSDKPYVK